MKSLRLRCIAEMIKVNQPLADIGSDHAILPVYLVKNGRVPRAVASDISPESCRRLLQTVQANGLEEAIEVRPGDGLQVLGPGEVATVVIAGLGGDTIAGILEKDWKQAESFAHYVLQPMSKAGHLRRVLAGRGWHLLQEEVVREKGRYYPVLVSRPGNDPYSLSSLEEDIGPWLLRQSGNDDYLLSWLKKYRQASIALGRAHRSDSEVLLAELQEKIKELEDWLNGGNR